MIGHYSHVTLQVKEEVHADEVADALLAAQHQATEARAAVMAKSAQLLGLQQQLEAAQTAEQAALVRLQAGRSAREDAAQRLQVRL